MNARAITLLGIFLLSPCVWAEDRFYQVIDANGHVQTIREPAKSNTKKTEADKDVAEAGRSEQHDDVVAPVAPIQKAGKPSTVKDIPYAVYDGEGFVDSEALDTAYKNVGKEKFYMVTDAAGTRFESISSNGGVAISAHDEAAVLAPSYVALKDNLRLLDGRKSGGGQECLSKQHLHDAGELNEGRVGDVIFDKRLARFLAPDDFVKIYRVDGNGLRDLQVRSYAGRDQDPEFVVPLLGFADKAGCVVRVLDVYFQRYYEPTKSRHPMLEAELTLHADDAYVFLMMPGRRDTENVVRPEYRMGSLGRVSMKWQK